MNNRKQHIKLLLTVAVLSTALSGCQNGRNGMFGANNWGRNGYANAFLNTGLNPYLMGDGQVVGYLVHNQSTYGNAPIGTNLNPQAGGVETGGANNQGAGGVQGGAPQTSGETPCTFKIASVSPNAYTQGSNQNFASMYNETTHPSSGRGVYQTGGRLGVTCGLDSEVAATQTSFLISGGSNSNTLWVYRANTAGAALGYNTQLTVGPNTKITASPSGHAAVITNNGNSLTLLMESRIGGDGGRVVDQFHSIPAPNGSKFADIVIDDRQGALYAAMALPGGAGQILIFRLIDIYNGVFRPVFNSKAVHNFNYNLPNETAVSFMFRQASPLKLKNNNGLTGVFTTMGHPFFMETSLGLDSSETYNRSPEEMNDAYQNTSDEQLTVQDIRVFDPFQTGYHANSAYTQQMSSQVKYKDFAVGNNMAYMITEQGVLYTIAVDSEYPMDASTPWERRLNMGMRLNTIEMSYDLKYAIIAGSNGVTLGNVVGNNLVLNSIGRPDIQDGNVIHATALAKIPREPTRPVAPPAATTATTPTAQR